MSYKARYEKKEDYVLVTFEGQESYEDAFNFWTGLLLESDFKDHKKFVVVGKPNKPLNHNEVQMLCVEIARMSKGKAIAYIDTNEDTFKINAGGETVAANRGRNAHVFRNEKEAVEWFKEVGIKE